MIHGYEPQTTYIACQKKLHIQSLCMFLYMPTQTQLHEPQTRTINAMHADLQAEKIGIIILLTFGNISELQDVHEEFQNDDKRSAAGPICNPRQAH